MKHIIFTNCNFDNDDLFYKYFEVMRKIYIPSVKSQICKDFLLFINVNPKKPEHFGVIQNEFADSNINYTLKMVGFKTRVIEDKYILQTRHDCDDYMSPTYVRDIQNLATEKFIDNEEFLIHAQPIKHEYNTNQYYHITPKYNEKHPSMFLTLCQKNPNKTILDVMHTKFSEVVPKIFDMGDKYARLTIHNNNKLSKLNHRDILMSNEELKEYI